MRFIPLFTAHIAARMAEKKAKIAEQEAAWRAVMDKSEKHKDEIERKEYERLRAKFETGEK